MLEKNVLLVYIYRLNSHLKCSFKNILKEKQENFSLQTPFLYVLHEVFIKVLLFQETCPVPKNPWLYVRNFQQNFWS